jgi:hypothetical protein
MREVSAHAQNDKRSVAAEIFAISTYFPNTPRMLNITWATDTMKPKFTFLTSTSTLSARVTNIQLKKQYALLTVCLSVTWLWTRDPRNGAMSADSHLFWSQLRKLSIFTPLHFYWSIILSKYFRFYTFILRSNFYTNYTQRYFCDGMCWNSSPEGLSQKDSNQNGVPETSFSWHCYN